VVTFTVLPLLVNWLPADGVGAARTSSAWEAALDGIVRTSKRRRDPILVATAILFVLWGTGWFGFLRVDTDGYEMYGEDSRVVRWIRFVEDRLGRSDDLEVEIALPAGDLPEHPQTLASVERFSEQLSGIDGLGPARSLLDPLSRLNRILHEDDPAYERPASSPAGNAELIELIGFEDPSLLESWVSFDRRRMRVSVEAAFQSYAERGRVLDQVRERARGLPASWSASLTGAYAMGHDWVSDVQATQLRSFATALAVVFLLLLAYLRSLAWALAALIPTLLPAFAILGSMGLLGLSLDVGRSMIAAVILGIGVDDTIHLLDRFRRHLDSGSKRHEAIREAVKAVGRPVITTSLALSLGFLSLMMSSWQTVSSFGFFVGIGIVIALLADLFVLPALVSTRLFSRVPS
jgi:predicted RND superfamily exporter protein